MFNMPDTKEMSRYIEEETKKDLPYIHCSKLNALTSIFLVISKFLKKNEIKKNVITKIAINSIRNTFYEYKFLKENCKYETCYDFLMNNEHSEICRKVYTMLKELKRSSDNLRAKEVGKEVDSALLSLENNDAVDLKRVYQIKARVGKDIDTHENKMFNIFIKRKKSVEMKPRNYSILSNYLSVQSSRSSFLKMDHSSFIKGDYITAGSSGIIYKGKLVSTGDEIAIKEFKDQSEDNENFLREVNVMSILSHDCLLLFYGYTVNKNCIITKYMKYGNLFDLLKKDELTGTDKTWIAYDIARGMNYLHSLGFIHRDLKSQNIFVDENKRGKIGDFGFAREKTSLPMTGLIGTEFWMAPEVILSHPNYDEKVDTYSYGIILWELLTGKQPFENLSNSMISIKIAMENLRPEIPSYCPVNLEKLIKRCWSRESSDRPSFRDIIELFENDNSCHYPGSETFLLNENMIQKTLQSASSARRSIFTVTEINEDVDIINLLNKACKNDFIVDVKSAILSLVAAFEREGFIKKHGKDVVDIACKIGDNHRVLMFRAMVEMFDNQEIEHCTGIDSSFLKLFKLNKPSIISNLLSLLTTLDNTYIFTDKVFRELLSFSSNDSSEIRNMAIRCLFKCHEKISTVSDIKLFLSFFVRRVPDDILNTAVSTIIKVFRRVEPKCLLFEFLRQLKVIYDYTEDQEVQTLVLNARFVLKTRLGYDPTSELERAASDFDNYRYVFYETMEFPEHLSIFTKYILEAASKTDAAFQYLTKIVRDNVNLCIKILEHTPLKLNSYKNSQTLYQLLVKFDGIDFSSYKIFQDENIYPVIMNLLRNKNIEKACTLIRQSGYNIQFINQIVNIANQLNMSLKASYKETDLLSIMTAMHNYMNAESSLCQVIYNSKDRMIGMINHANKEVAKLSRTCLAQLGISEEDIQRNKR